jgi:hypothetical protein
MTFYELFCGASLFFIIAVCAIGLLVTAGGESHD